jgi:hypothetical protein
MLDIVHHVEPAAVRPLLAELHATLLPGACLLVKDVDTRPAYKRWFTHALDLLVSPGSPPHYWAARLCRRRSGGGSGYRHRWSTSPVPARALRVPEAPSTDLSGG